MRSAPSVFVYCDECQFEEEIILDNDFPVNESYVTRKLELLGWRVTSEKDLCEDCIAMEEEDGTAIRSC